MFGNEAPESAQTSIWPVREINCGRIARTARKDLKAGVDMTCRAVGSDPGSAIVAFCADPQARHIGCNKVSTG